MFKRLKRAVVVGVVIATSAATLHSVGCRTDEGTVTQPQTSNQPFAKVVQPQPIGQRATTNFGDATATSVKTADGISTTLKNPAGATLATLVWSNSSWTFTWTVLGTGSQTESMGDALPSLKGSNYAVYMVHKNVQKALALGKASDSAPADEPGCDWVPDWLETECILACCAIHDACYAANGCTARSWIPFVGSAACKACNRAAVVCIASCVADAIIEIIPEEHEQH